MRCFGSGDPLMLRYHDEEWGCPVTDERGMYERLCLEAFQAGLSWRTVLYKREALRVAFADFDPGRVAGYGEREIQRLMRDARIIRNRAKIEAVIGNAQALARLIATGGSLVEVVWSFAPAHVPAPLSVADWPAKTPESEALAVTLRRLGFHFVGPTTAYATMQAAGVVNDHLRGCPLRASIELARRRFRAEC